ncbi:MAG: 3-methyl-2-oxobutanoate hydroxymethyltransferase [Desulfovibrio sp.]|nr:3-methyl-2-oxobutanoate hydroxymethyltransferase [Desulfovibrio sp.]
MKITPRTFREAKNKRKLALLTAYDYGLARLIDECGIDGILVGDSLGMTTLGYSDTIPVTMEDMIHHCAAVSRGAKNALIICDMPFMSSQLGPLETVRNAGRLLKEGGAQAVKLEGGAEFAPEIAALTRASIPVMAHIGLTPQSARAMGGYKVQGKSLAEAKKVLNDARALEEAGAFAILMECVPAPLARLITSGVSVPTIGIGAGSHCDGQILVWQDMLGVSPGTPPKFVRRFAELGQTMREAFDDYKRSVETGEFPAPAHSYAMSDEVADALTTEEK